MCYGIMFVKTLKMLSVYKIFQFLFCNFQLSAVLISIVSAKLCRRQICFLFKCPGKALRILITA